MKKKTPEEIERAVAEEIKANAPHADPVIILALMNRLRDKLKEEHGISK